MDITNSLSYASSLAANTNTTGAIKAEEKKSANAAESSQKPATEQNSAEQEVATTAEADDTQEASATGLDVKSIMKDFKKAMNDQLLKSMGLGSTDELAAKMAGAGISSMSVSVQFELNYQCVSCASGAATGTSMSLSLSASFELSGISSGFGSGFNPFAPAESGESQETDPLASLKEFFSPENTAQRILDFSLSFFGQSSMYKESGDTEESRSAFADMMGKAIQKGFDQALGILGDLPEQTAKEVDQTHELVFQGLDNFIKNGQESEKDGLYAQLQEYTTSYQYSMSYSSLNSSWNGGSQSASSLNVQASYQRVQSSYSYGTGTSAVSGSENVTV